MTVLIGAAAVLLVAWFAAGTIWNVRLGSQVMRWMQEGLPVLGSRSTVRWLGSSVVELVINEGKAALASAAVVIFMEPRDLPWWPLSRMQGRRDTLIIRGVLRRTPSVELEALDPASWSGRDALRRLSEKRWSVREPASPDDLTVYHKFPRSLAMADSLTAIARGGGVSVRRLALHPAEVPFELHADLPASGNSAAEFFTAVCAIGERAGAA